MIHIKPENGTVRKHEKLEVEVTFSPTSELRFKGKASRLSLQIISGPIYHFDIRGSARKPNVELSFYHHNFGP
jgi:hydrocephalus-inducing protein